MKRPVSLVPRYSGDSFGPGDLVEGVLEVREPVDRVERLVAHLKYLDRSPSYSGAVTYASAEPLHEGPLVQGQEIPFAFRLPADALPVWDDPMTDGMGTLSWALVIETEVRRGLDTITTHSVPVDGSALWLGPPPTADGAVEATGKRWDVEIAPDRWYLRRGETLTVRVDIGEPAAGRDTLKLGVFCRADYAVEVRRTDSDGDPHNYKEFRHAKLFESWPELDTTKASQTLEFELPADAPFSYDGNAFAIRWFVMAREARRLRVDPHRAVRLQVMP